jgi:hypothetical protein
MWEREMWPSSSSLGVEAAIEAKAGEDRLKARWLPMTAALRGEEKRGAESRDRDEEVEIGQEEATVGEARRVAAKEEEEAVGLVRLRRRAAVLREEESMVLRRSGSEVCESTGRVPSRKAEKRRKGSRGGRWFGAASRQTLIVSALRSLSLIMASLPECTICLENLVGISLAGEEKEITAISCVRPIPSPFPSAIELTT